MKKILFTTLIFITAFVTQASHLAGGRIWYEYAGNAQFPYRYDVYMILERDISGIPMTGSLPASICITSTCFGAFNVSAPLVPIIPKIGSDTVLGSYPGSIRTPDQDNCISTTSPGFVISESYLVRAQVDLPGKCADFSFAYSVNARNSSSNLTTTGNFYIETKLNNMHGPNSSPRFINPAAKSFCIGTAFQWSQQATEPDLDSIHYEFGTPQAGSCSNPTPMSFSSGYSLSSPMTTVSGINLNPHTGLLSFTPSQQEIVVIHVIATEYRLHPVLQIWYIVGTSEMDIQISIVSACRVENGKWFTDRTDSLQNIDPILCGDSLINIKTERKFRNSSLAADGSDFAILNSRGGLVPIIEAGIGAKGNSSNEASSFWLKLNDAIAYNDTLTLITRVGNDLNTLINTCGNELKAGDSVRVIANACNTWIGQDEPTLSPFQIYPNPVENKLQVNLPKNEMNGQIQVFDVSGKVVFRKVFMGESQPMLKLDFLPPGIYVLKVTADQWSQVAKFEKL